MPRKVVEKPFNGGQWSRARFFGFIRSALRKASMKWPPRYEARRRCRRQYKGPDKRRKYEYQCAICKHWFPGGETEQHHAEPCGSLNDYDDLPDFVRKLLCEADGWVEVCRSCHKQIPDSAAEK